MRIGLDGKCLRDRVGGISRYVEGLLSGVSRLKDAPAIEVLTPDGATMTVTWAPWRLQRATGDRWNVFHFPFYYPPLRPRCPVTVVIHDILPIERPEWFPRPVGRTDGRADPPRCTHRRRHRDRIRGRRVPDRDGSRRPPVAGVRGAPRR